MCLDNPRNLSLTCIHGDDKHDDRMLIKSSTFEQEPSHRV